MMTASEQSPSQRRSTPSIDTSSDRDRQAMNAHSPLRSHSLSPPPSPTSPEEAHQCQETLKEMRDCLTKIFKESKIPGALALTLTNLALTVVSFKAGGPFAAFDSAFYTGGALMATAACLLDPEKNAKDMYKLLTEMGAPGVVITGLIKHLSGEDDNWSKTGKGFGKYAKTLALSTALSQVTDTLSPLLSGDRPKGFNIIPPNFDALDDMERGGVSEEEREEKREALNKKRNAFLKSLLFIVPSVLANTGALKQMFSLKNPLNGEAIPPVVMGAVDGATLSGFLEVWKTVCDPKMKYKDTVRKIQDLCLSIPFACAGEVALQFAPKKNPITDVALTTTSALLLMGITRHIMDRKTQESANPDENSQNSYASLSPEGSDDRNQESDIEDALSSALMPPQEESSDDDNGNDISDSVIKRLNGVFMRIRNRYISLNDAENAMSAAVAASAEESKAPSESDIEKPSHEDAHETYEDLRKATIAAQAQGTPHATFSAENSRLADMV